MEKYFSKKKNKTTKPCRVEILLDLSLSLYLHIKGQDNKQINQAY